MSNSSRSKQPAAVIYDGECRFCIAQVERMRKLDTGQELEFMPRQAAQTEQRFPQIKGKSLEEGIVLIDANGAGYVAADAIYEIFKRLPSRRKLTWLYEVPLFKPIIQAGYRLVAANRRRLGQVCAGDRCKLPDN